MFRKTKIEWVPELDADTTNPVYARPSWLRCKKCGAEFSDWGQADAAPPEARLVHDECGGELEIVRTAGTK